MRTAHVEKIFADLSSLGDVLRDAGEASLWISAEDYVRKTMLIAAASAFESSICEAIERFYREQHGSTIARVSFVRNKGLSRQYHTFFNWKDKSVTQFFGLFGENFKAIATARYKQDSAFKDAADAFMDIGAERNRLAHDDYASYTLELTAAEINEKLLKGAVFVRSVEEMLWTKDTAIPRRKLPTVRPTSSVRKRKLLGRHRL